MNKRRIGLVVNPIAGMGGAVGLKGTDGDNAARARELGADPVAAPRTRKTLEARAGTAQDIDWLTSAGNMGADCLAAAELPFDVVHDAAHADTGSADTRAAVQALLDHKVELVVFAGGDGTATEVLAIVDQRVPMLGIPAGVKMHSAVFAISPRAAADVIAAFVAAGDADALLDDAEVMDRPAGQPNASPVLLGYARTPIVPSLVQHGKAAGATGSIESACDDAFERIRDEGLVLIGPGSTMLEIKRQLGFDGTLLGVDAVRNGEPVGIDLNAADILAIPDLSDAWLLMGVIGGQGFLFGRGNQQLSADVLRRIDRDRIVIVSSTEKLFALPERQLYVDTGDDAVDNSLAGYLPVTVGYRRRMQVRVGPPPHIEAETDRGMAPAGTDG